MKSDNLQGDSVFTNDCQYILDVRDLSAQCDTDAELQDHRKRIQTLSEETAVSLKKNVYKNYMQFIETSKEISCILEARCLGKLPDID